MKNNLSLLVQIQEMDLEIQGLERKNRDCPREIEKIQKDIDSVKENDIRSREDLEDLIKKRMALEGELEVDKEKLKGWQQQLNQAQNEKEYRAFLKDINGTKKKNEKMEEDILEIMEKIDESEKNIENEKKVLDDLFVEFGDIKKEINKKMKAFEEELAEKKRVSLELAKEIRSDFLQKYESLKSGHRKNAIVRAKNGSCLGCHMSLPPQVFIQVQMRSSLVNCPFCRRILYWEEDN